MDCLKNKSMAMTVFQFSLRFLFYGTVPYFLYILLFVIGEKCCFLSLFCKYYSELKMEVHIFLDIKRKAFLVAAAAIDV